MPTAPNKSLQVSDEALDKIDAIAESVKDVYGQATSLKEAVQLAQAISDLRAAMTDEIMKPIMALMNSNLGFRTDKDPVRNPKVGAPYSIDVVREVCIEAMLRGFRPAGNEFNIISGGFYAAKNGLDRKVKNFPGVTDFRMFFDVPEMKTSGATVKCKATWVRDGVPDSLDAILPIKVNEYMGADAILGKAERKLLARVLGRLTGTNVPEGEPGEDAPAHPVLGPSKPLFSSGPPPDTTEPAKTPPEAVSAQPQGTPEPTHQPQNAYTLAKQNAIKKLIEKMTSENVGIDQVMTYLIESGDAPENALRLEDVATSKLVAFLANFDSKKVEIAAIEV